MNFICNFYWRKVSVGKPGGSWEPTAQLTFPSQNSSDLIVRISKTWWDCNLWPDAVVGGPTPPVPPVLLTALLSVRRHDQGQSLGPRPFIATYSSMSEWTQSGKREAGIYIWNPRGFSCNLEIAFWLQKQ